MRKVLVFMLLAMAVASAQQTNYPTNTTSVGSVSGTANQIASTGGATPRLSLTSPVILPGLLGITGAGTANVPTIYDAADSTTGFHRLGANGFWYFARAGTDSVAFGTGLFSADYFSLNSDTNLSLSGGVLSVGTGTAGTRNGVILADGNKAVLTADWTCGTGGTVSSCVAAVIIGSGGGVPLTFTLPSAAGSYQLDCDLIVGQATAATANNWNLLTATNGATNVMAFYDMYTAATAKAAGATTGQASTTTTFNIGGTWTLGGTATKMPVHIHAAIEGASASGTVLSLQLVAPTVADLVTIYRGSSCSIH